MRERTASRLILFLGLLFLATIAYIPSQNVVAAQLPPSWATVFFIDKASGTINLATLKTKLGTDAIAYTEPSGDLPFYNGYSVYWKTYGSVVLFSRPIGGDIGTAYKQYTYTTTESVVVCFSLDFSAVDKSYVLWQGGYASEKVLALPTAASPNYIRGSGSGLPAPQYPLQATLDYVYTNGGTSSSGTKTFASTYLTDVGYLLLVAISEYGYGSSSSWVHWSFSGLTYTLKKAWLYGVSAGGNMVECPEGTWWANPNQDVTSLLASDTTPRAYATDAAGGGTAGAVALAIVIQTSGVLSAPTYQFQDQDLDWVDEYYYAPCRHITASPTFSTAFTASGLPSQPMTVSRTTVGKIWYDPFTSTGTSGQYEAVSSSSSAVTTSGGRFSGEGYLRVYVGDSPGSGGTGQCCYARTQYVGTVSRGVVAVAYASYDTNNGDQWVTFWYMGNALGNAYRGYKVAAKSGGDSVRILEQTGEGSYSTLSDSGAVYSSGWTLLLFTADSSSVLRAYWKSINWESAPTNGDYSSGKIGFGGRQDYVKWSHFIIQSSRTITVNGLQSGLTVDLYYGSTVAVTGTASGSSLALDTWSAMKSEYVPPYTKFVVRNGATVLYDSASAGQFSNDIYGGDVFSFSAAASYTAQLTLGGQAVGNIPPTYSAGYAQGQLISFSVPTSINCGGTMYYFQRWQNAAGQTISWDPSITNYNIQSDNTFTVYYAQTAVVRNTVTTFQYASATTRTTSSTTNTPNLVTTYITQPQTTSITQTVPTTNMIIPGSTILYSTTTQTATTSTTTTTTKTTTTSYAGRSSTATVLLTNTATSTGNSTATQSLTITTTTATSLSTSVSTSAILTSTTANSFTTVTATSYQSSTTTAGTYITTTSTTIIGTSVATTGGTIYIMQTEMRQVLTSYTESVGVNQQPLGQSTINTILTSIFKLGQSAYNFFFTSVQTWLTDIVTYIQNIQFTRTEEVINYEPMGVQITINSNPQGAGFIKVDGTPYTTPYNFTWSWGSVHQIEALSPVSGGAGTQYIFTSWNDTGAQVHSINATSPLSIVANYKTQYQLTMQASPPASGTVSPSSGWYDVGASVTIQATANPTFTFSSWLGVGSGSYSGSAASHSITMNGPITETAQFGVQYVSITFGLSGINSVSDTVITIDSTPYSFSSFPKTFSWIAGSGHSITANTPISIGPGSQYTFASWTNGDGLSGASGTYAAPLSDQTVTLNYKTQYRLTIQVNNPAKGTTNPVPGIVWYDSGSNPQVTAQPNSGQQLGYWELDGNNVGSANPYSVLMGGAHTLNVVLVSSQVQVGVTSFPTGANYVAVDGVNVTTPWNGFWAYNTPHTIKANTPMGRNRFKQWDDGSTTIQRSITATGDSMMFQAIFTVQYQLTVSTSPTGLISPTISPSGGPWYDSGTPVHLTAGQATGMTFLYWKVDTVSQGDGVSQIDVFMSADHTAIAYYTFVGGPHSSPSISFSFTAPVATPLLAILTLIAALILRRTKRRIIS